MENDETISEIFRLVVDSFYSSFELEQIVAVSIIFDGSQLPCDL